MSQPQKNQPLQPVQAAFREMAISEVEEVEVQTERADPRVVNQLTTSAFFGNTEVVKNLLKTHPLLSANDTDPVTGDNAVHSAAAFGRLGLFRYLVEEAKGNPTAQNHMGRNALHIASERGNGDVVKYLVDTFQMKTDVRDKQLRTASDIAQLKQRTDVVSFFKQQAEQSKKKLPDWFTIPSESIKLGNILGKGRFSTVFGASYAGEEVAVKRPIHQEAQGGAKSAGGGGGGGGGGGVSYVDVTEEGVTAEPKRAKGAKPAKQDAERANLEKRLMLDAFENEVRVIRLLGQHPRLVRFFGACTEASKEMLVMALMQQGSLEDTFMVKRPIPYQVHQRVPKAELLVNIRLLARVLTDASAAICHLHDRRVIHRDIGARNFLLDQQQRVSVSDLGSSLVLPMESETGTAPPYGKVAVKYCAPEMLSKRAYSRATDVYMCGSFIFEMVARYRPFQDVRFGYQDPVREIVNASLRPAIPGWCPRELEELIMRCWDKDPEKRPSMKEVHGSLGAFQKVCDTATTADAAYHPKDTASVFTEMERDATSAYSMLPYRGAYRIGYRDGEGANAVGYDAI